MDVNFAEEWLRSIGLIQYTQAFIDNGYDEAEVCKQIGDPDLDAIGVTKPRHRKLVMEAVEKLQSVEANRFYFTLENINSVPFGYSINYGDNTIETSFTTTPDSNPQSSCSVRSSITSEVQVHYDSDLFSDEFDDDENDCKKSLLDKKQSDEAIDISDIKDTLITHNTNKESTPDSDIQKGDKFDSLDSRCSETSSVNNNSKDTGVASGDSLCNCDEDEENEKRDIIQYGFPNSRPNFSPGSVSATIEDNNIRNNNSSRISSSNNNTPTEGDLPIDVNKYTISHSKRNASLNSSRCNSINSDKSKEFSPTTSSESFSQSVLDAKKRVSTNSSDGTKPYDNNLIHTNVDCHKSSKDFKSSTKDKNMCVTPIPNVVKRQNTSPFSNTKPRERPRSFIRTPTNNNMSDGFSTFSPLPHHNSDPLNIGLLNNRPQKLRTPGGFKEDPDAIFKCDMDSDNEDSGSNNESFNDDVKQPFLKKRIADSSSMESVDEEELSQRLGRMEVERPPRLSRTTAEFSRSVPSAPIPHHCSCHTTLPRNWRNGYPPARGGHPMHHPPSSSNKDHNSYRMFSVTGENTRSKPPPLPAFPPPSCSFTDMSEIDKIVPQNQRISQNNYPYWKYGLEDDYGPLNINKNNKDNSKKQGTFSRLFKFRKSSRKHQYKQLQGDLNAGDITMSDDDRIQLMILVKEGKLSMHDAVEMVKRYEMEKRRERDEAYNDFLLSEDIKIPKPKSSQPFPLRFLRKCSLKSSAKSKRSVPTIFASYAREKKGEVPIEDNYCNPSCCSNKHCPANTMRRQRSGSLSQNDPYHATCKSHLFCYGECHKNNATPTDNKAKRCSVSGGSLRGGSQINLCQFSRCHSQPACAMEPEFVGCQNCYIEQCRMRDDMCNFRSSNFDRNVAGRHSYHGFRSRPPSGVSLPSHIPMQYGYPMQQQYPFCGSQTSINSYASDCVGHYQYPVHPQAHFQSYPQHFPQQVIHEDQPADFISPPRGPRYPYFDPLGSVKSLNIPPPRPPPSVHYQAPRTPQLIHRKHSFASQKSNFSHAIPQKPPLLAKSMHRALSATETSQGFTLDEDHDYCNVPYSAGGYGRRSIYQKAQDVLAPQSLEDLCRKLGIEHLYSCLVENGFETVDLFNQIDESDLDELNITNAQDRAKVLTAVRLLPVIYSEGSTVSTYKALPLEDDNFSLTDGSTLPRNLAQIEDSDIDSDSEVEIVHVAPTGKTRDSGCYMSQPDDSLDKMAPKVEFKTEL